MASDLRFCDLLSSEPPLPLPSAVPPCWAEPKHPIAHARAVSQQPPEFELFAVPVDEALFATAREKQLQIFIPP